MSLFIKEIKNILEKSIKKLGYSTENLIVEKSKQGSSLNFASNYGLINSKILKKNPMELATEILNDLKDNKLFESVEVTKPGFLNFVLKQEVMQKIINKVLSEKDNFGKQEKKNKIFNLELVSANPTGFLHVGHGRNGIIADCVARLLRFSGYDVQTEYYTNDAGNQINVLACTMFYNYKKLLNSNVNTPEEMYGGDMYSEVAQKFVDKYKDKFIKFDIIDGKINDEEAHEIFKSESIDFFLNEIVNQLKLFDINIEHYSSEAAMYHNKSIDKMLEKYAKINSTYEKDGALWLRTTDFGDDKDRVLIKSDGTKTYITPDLACHNDRIIRSKADKYVNFWGGDHHGYIVRLRAGLALLGYDFNLLDIDMIQMVRLIKDGKEFKMSKRKGTAVWLLDLFEMLGKDPIRYMLASKAPSSHMDLDIDLILQKNSSNPVFYAKYATARCYKLMTKFLDLGEKVQMNNFNLLNELKEREIMLQIDQFENNVKYAAESRLPSIICDYIQTLSKSFHSYYSDSKIFDEENMELTRHRISLVNSVYQVLSNAFNLIGIDVVNEM